MGFIRLHLLIGWGWMLLGIVSGAVIGLFFHREEWLGGYASFRRRMLRLGHIAFFGLGFLNLLFAFSMRATPLPHLDADIASVGFALGAVSMPLCCFLTAWRPQMRHLFPIPVIATAAGIVPVLFGYFTR